MSNWSWRHLLIILALIVGTGLVARLASQPPSCADLQSAGARLITHSAKGEGGRIVGLCNPAQGLQVDIAAVIADAGGRTPSALYYTRDEEQCAPIVVRYRFGSAFVTSWADASASNNLRNLPDC